ncbi:conjugal transfer protein TraD [Litorisediminicola beolgyonensis]|uniref:Conjugal transfer protein TraD n=1 Tax=Litorisediminicola beolgyonensis TaxID=1173614 RepID=A0ABW3ZDR5_9RHOB
MDRRTRTRQLIELGGLVKKAGIVEITDDDRTLIFGALLWMADRLEGEQGNHARKVWRDWGRAAFEIDAKEKAGKSRQSFEADEKRT